MYTDQLMKMLFRQCTFLMVFGFSITACGPDLYWAKPGAKPGDYDRDVIDCKRALAGSQGGGYSASSLNPAYGIPQSAVEQCMGQKGWYLAEKPPDEEPIDPPR